jgi:enoyl-CoA hydratase
VPPGLIRKQDGPVLTVLIRHPELRNALSRTIVTQLQRVLLEVAENDSIAAIIIGSALEKVFASGGNIRELHDLHGATEGLSFAVAIQQAFQLIADCPIPVIVAINGYCLGAGLEMALAADIRIAADNAIFASPQVALGITPGLGGGQRLARLCRRAHARRLILTGDRIDAAEALRIGLVEQVVPVARLWAAAMEIAQTLATKPRSAIAYAKRALREADHSCLEAGTALEAVLFGLACAEDVTGRSELPRPLEAGACP